MLHHMYTYTLIIHSYPKHHEVYMPSETGLHSHCSLHGLKFSIATMDFCHLDSSEDRGCHDTRNLVINTNTGEFPRVFVPNLELQ